MDGVENANNLFVLLASALLSLLFFYVPGFKTWYDKLSSEAKQLVMVTLIFAVTASNYATQVYTGQVIFGWESVLDSLALFFVALATNAGVYRSVRYIRGEKPVEQPYLEG